MKSLIKAGNDIIKIVLECEKNLDDLPIVIGRISTEVKIHGHPIPTPLILDLVAGFDEEKLEMAFTKLSQKWGGNNVN